MSPDFELESCGIDTAALEKEIEKRIKARREAGAYNHDVEALLAERLPEEDGSGDLPALAALDYSATRAMSSWEVSTAYPVATEKKIIAPFIIFVKRIARIWARIAVGPIQREQTAFNRHVSNALGAINREAIAERTRDTAADEDLAELAEALIGEDDTSWIVSTVKEELGDTRNLTVLCPCPKSMISLLRENGFFIYKISPGTTWEEPGDKATGTAGSPSAFLCQAPEESINALVLSELVFINDPGRIVYLLRQSYLALEKSGTIAVVAHGLATGVTSPWCAAPVMEKALGIAGFKNINIKSGPGGGLSGATPYVAIAGK